MTGASVQRRLPALLRDPGPFRYLFWGQALSVLGDRVVPIAIAFGVLGIGSTTDLVLVLAATATLLITGTAHVWMLAALSFAYGLSAASFMPAFMGLIPQVVAPGQLQEANALIALTRSLANVAGPALAGAIIALSGPGQAIAVDAATFLVSAACLLRLQVGPV